MKKLVVHAGSHKTGSTSIQLSLKDIEDQLKRKKIKLFDIDPNGSVNPYGHCNHWVRHYGSGTEFDAEVLPELRNELKCIDADTVIFSAEHLFWINSIENIKSFHNLIHDLFDEITIIFYLRRQDKLLLSHHQQGSKLFGWCEQLYYGSEPKAYPTGDFSAYLDYYSKLRKWASIFGKSSLKVRVFEPESLVGGDAVIDFCSLIDSDLKVVPRKVNESRSKHQVIVGHILNSLGVSHLDESRIKLLELIHCNEKLMPSRKEAEQLYSQYRLSNKYLNEFLNISKNPYIFNEDFNSYPEEVNENYLDTLKTVLRSIYPQANFTDLDVFALRDAAIVLEDKKPKLAYRLIKVARQLRPNGKIIKEVYERLDARINSDKQAHEAN